MSSAELSTQLVERESIEYLKVAKVEERLKEINKSLGIEIPFDSIEEMIHLTPINFKIDKDDKEFLEKSKLLREGFDLAFERAGLLGLAIKPVETVKPAATKYVFDQVQLDKMFEK